MVVSSTLRSRGDYRCDNEGTGYDLLISHRRRTRELSWRSWGIVKEESVEVEKFRNQRSERKDGKLRGRGRGELVEVG